MKTLKYSSAPPPLKFKGYFRFLMVVSIFTLICASCSKDAIKPQGIAEVDAKYVTYYKLRSFMERFEGKEPTHPALLPRTGYNVSQIIEYVEGTLNLVYADPSLTWETTVRSTDTFSLALQSGYASEQDVEDLFAEARDSASAFFYSITEEDKFPYLFDAVVLFSSSGQVDISVMTMVGKVHKDLTPFGEYDYWDIFQDMATCDPYDEGPNASDVMTDAINDYYQDYACHFFTNESEISSPDPSPYPSITGWGADNPNESAGDWIMDFRTFKTICNSATNECLDFVNNGVYCLAPDEMNFYFGQIISIFDDYSEEIELALITADIELQEKQVGNYFHKQWECNNFWGTINYCDEGNDYPHQIPFCCN